jgi:hypothetical protein
MIEKKVKSRSGQAADTTLSDSQLGISANGDESQSFMAIQDQLLEQRNKKLEKLQRQFNSATTTNIDNNEDSLADRHISSETAQKRNKKPGKKPKHHRPVSGLNQSIE